MSVLLRLVSNGRIKKPFFITLYGPPGVGKSSFAAGAPKTIFCGPEEGTFNMDVSRFPRSKNFDEIMNCISELRNEKHDFQTLALDTLDAIEPLIWNTVCGLDGSETIDEAQGSYGKGYVMANKYWARMIEALHDLRDYSGMNIIALAHSQVKSFNDPSLLQPYDRYQLKLNEKASALWRETCDLMGFADFQTFLKEGDTEKKNRALGEGKRILYTERRPAFDAKNRLGLPSEIPLSFQAFEQAVLVSTPLYKDPLALKSKILKLKEILTDEKIKKAVRESLDKAGDETEKLIPILNRLEEITKGAT